MAKVKTPRWGWALTGSGHFFKECLAAVATQLALLTRQPPAAIPPFTSRPPLAPTPLRVLARDPGAHRFADDREESERKT